MLSSYEWIINFAICILVWFAVCVFIILDLDPIRNKFQKIRKCLPLVCDHELLQDKIQPQFIPLVARSTVLNKKCHMLS